MLTSLLPPAGFVPTREVSVENRAKIKFTTASTIKSVFKASDPPASDLALFIESRAVVNLETLDENEKTLWNSSWRNNRIFCGYLVYAIVYPAILKRRIKLRDVAAHWITLDASNVKGKLKLAGRASCEKVLETMTATSCYRGVSDFVNVTVLARDFLGLTVDDDGVLFFRKRDFPAKKSSCSSDHTSCAAILSCGRHDSFGETVSPRLCSHANSGSREHSVGKVESLWESQPNHRELEAGCLLQPSGLLSSHYEGLFIERLTSDTYLEVYPCDTFLVYKSHYYCKSSDDSDGIVIQPSIKYATHNTVVVSCFDALLARTESCDLDAVGVSSIAMEFGAETARKMSTTATVGVFSASLGRKINETIKFFSEKHSLVHLSVKQRLKVVQSMDPGGVKNKLSKGRMLDPRVPANVQAVREIIRGTCATTWLPAKRPFLNLVPSISLDMDVMQNSSSAPRARGSQTPMLQTCACCCP